MIYFLRHGDMIRIGHTDGTNSLVNKLRHMLYSTHQKDDIELLGIMLGGRNVELELHQRYTAHHLNGDWFRLEGAILDHPVLLASRGVPPRVGHYRVTTQADHATRFPWMEAEELVMGSFSESPEVCGVLDDNELWQDPKGGEERIVAVIHPSSDAGRPPVVLGYLVR